MGSDDQLQEQRPPLSNKSIKSNAHIVLDGKSGNDPQDKRKRMHIAVRVYYFRFSSFQTVFVLQAYNVIGDRRSHNLGSN